MHFEDEIYCFLYKVEVHHFKLASNPSQITLLQMQKTGVGLCSRDYGTCAHL